MATPSASQKLTPAGRGPLASIQGIIGAKLLYDVLTLRKVSYIDNYTDRNPQEEAGVIPELPVGCKFEASLSAPPFEGIDVSLLAPDDSLIAAFEIPEYRTVTSKQAEATNVTINNIVVQEEGKSAIDELPDKVKNLGDRAAEQAQFDDAEDYGREAVKQADAHHNFAKNDAVARAIRIGRGNQDRSRVSKEYHEWKYCCVDSNNFSLLQDVTNGLEYALTDGPSTAPGVTPASTYVPPYYQWLKHDDLREAMKLVRRFRRMRGQCGGKALWEEQGYASKTEAIQNDLYASSDWSDLQVALIATPDFQAPV